MQTIIQIAAGVFIAQCLFVIPFLLSQRSSKLSRKRKREEGAIERIEEELFALSRGIRDVEEKTWNKMNEIDTREKTTFNRLMDDRKRFGALEVRFNDKQTVDKIVMETIHNKLSKNHKEFDGIHKELKELTDRVSDLSKKIEVVGQNKPEQMPTDERNDYDRFGEQFIKMVNLYVNEQETELGQAKAIQNIVEIMLSGSRQNREWWTKQVKTWAALKK